MTDSIAQNNNGAVVTRNGHFVIMNICYGRAFTIKKISKHVQRHEINNNNYLYYNNLTHQMSFTNINLKGDQLTGGKCSIHCP